MKSSPVIGFSRSCGIVGRGAARRLSGYALLLVLILLAGCVTGAVDEQTVSTRDWEEEIPGTFSSFDKRNLVRANGVTMAFPAGWRIVRVGDSQVFGEHQEGSVVVYLSVGTDGSERVLEQYDTTDSDRLLLGGEYAEVSYFPGGEPRIPRLVYWNEHEPSLLLEFLGSREAVAEDRENVTAILSSLRRDPYRESGRFVEGLYVFHGHGSGWEFVRDIQNGAVFGWFDQPPTGRDGWTSHPRLLLILRRGAPIDAAVPTGRAEVIESPGASEYVTTITEAGPLLYKPYRHRVVMTDAGPLLTADPESPEDDDWHLGLLAGTGNQEFMYEDGAVWGDKRIRTFFACCFAAAP